MRTPLTPEALQLALATLPNWHLEANQLTRTLTFATFPAAIAFVNTAAALAIARTPQTTKPSWVTARASKPTPPKP